MSKINLRLGRLVSELLAPGYGKCGRCKTAWRFVEGHCTPYEHGRACFPLCEKCWSALTPLTRLPYYRTLLDSWKVDAAEMIRKRVPHWNISPEQQEAVWPGMKKSVLEGL